MTAFEKEDEKLKKEHHRAVRVLLFERGDTLPAPPRSDAEVKERLKELEEHALPELSAR